MRGPLCSPFKTSVALFLRSMAGEGDSGQTALTRAAHRGSSQTQRQQQLSIESADGV